MNTENKAVQMVTVSDDEAGQRIDNFLLKRLKGVPKSRIYRILRKGEVRVNKKRVKPEYKVVGSDIVRIPPIRVAEETGLPSNKLNQVVQLEQHIVYEDDCLLVINKPSGMAVHGGSGLSFGVIEALRSLRQDCRYLELVHRIDRDTSGLLVVAKKRSALREMHRQLREKVVQKDYLTLVHGQWPKSTKTVDAPLRKNAVASGERIVIVDHQEGKASLTRYRIERRFADMTLMKASPVTGRTHQIRVHSQYEGHSIAGDDKYTSRELLSEAASQGLHRLFLHAWQIRFTHPATEKEMHLTAPLESSLKSYLDKLTPL
ncbi:MULTISPECIES: 23S rRNA pseudouridine(955/2504/2580) synthase RluC [unclassified Agarivorans]|uniref:23S rRNA pseudouridine(955/2504/2580) synthase RluC n=1 Tax=unclassified Agarivorans TaxID=2636026 RepID=UPI0026E2C63C|nr:MULTISPECIES: 23S rRNA pseudouridine(955/2504/2580) synthase RluC [unclassified Agarivorans]MDO6686013.1 23S rRNA pseudouridine(955/2504/2580) synthase RluC [Agarivorans sp. 3_MG-2023]MDO6713849.1 23S rRNA pseudouridine(955/2504/2580) synthase RluC [Agarivorans sp. 2_MG-2023]